MAIVSDMMLKTQAIKVKHHVAVIKMKTSVLLLARIFFKSQESEMITQKIEENICKFNLSKSLCLRLHKKTLQQFNNTVIQLKIGKGVSVQTFYIKPI